MLWQALASAGDHVRKSHRSEVTSEVTSEVNALVENRDKVLGEDGQAPSKWPRSGTGGRFDSVCLDRCDPTGRVDSFSSSEVTSQIESLVQNREKLFEENHGPRADTGFPSHVV